MNRAIKRLLIDVVLLDGKRAETRDPNGGGPCGGCGEQHGYSLRSDGVHTCKGCGTERYDESPPAPAPSLEDMARRAKDLLDEPQAKRRRVLAKSRPRREKRAGKKAVRAERQSVVYAAVDARSDGACEQGNGVVDCRNDATDHDHFWGRGKAPETPENVWHLCRFHHRNKTDNSPTRRHWLEFFRIHCRRNGFEDEVAKIDRALALETAQHPANGGQS